MTKDIITDSSIFDGYFAKKEMERQIQEEFLYPPRQKFNLRIEYSKAYFKIKQLKYRQKFMVAIFDHQIYGVRSETCFDDAITQGLWLSILPLLNRDRQYYVNSLKGGRKKLPKNEESQND